MVSRGRERARRRLGCDARDRQRADRQLLVRRLIELGVSPARHPHHLRHGHPSPRHAGRKARTADALHRAENQDARPRRLRCSQHVTSARLSAARPSRSTALSREHDHVILTGAIDFHYFAGFTGGRKSVCPGLASARTIEATHMLALDFERGGRRAGVGTGLLDGNAVHEECERIAAEIAPSFLDQHGRRTSAGRPCASTLETGARRTAAACAEYHATSIPSRLRRSAPLVVASCGGSPWDINLIQAHKTLDMAAHACPEGGDIILVAECADGLGRADFLKWFEETDSSRARSAAARALRSERPDRLVAAVKGREVSRSSRLRAADEDVRRMRMTPARTIDEALARVDSNAAGLHHAARRRRCCQSSPACSEWTQACY